MDKHPLLGIAGDRISGLFTIQPHISGKLQLPAKYRHIWEWVKTPSPMPPNPPQKFGDSNDDCKPHLWELARALNHIYCARLTRQRLPTYPQPLLRLLKTFISRERYEQLYSLRCRTASNKKRVAAEATLRELIRPFIGMRALLVAPCRQTELSPSRSVPTATATGPRKSASV